MSKKKKSYLKMHPLHFHIGMYVAIAAMLVTAGKSSAHVIEAGYNDHSADQASHSEMREAETRHDAAMLSSTKLATQGGE